VLLTLQKWLVGWLWFNGEASGGGGQRGLPPPTRKTGPLGGAVAGVFPNVSITRYVPPKTLLGPLLARLWRPYWAKLQKSRPVKQVVNAGYWSSHKRETCHRFVLTMYDVCVHE